jgi:hypothetical protein
MTAYDDESYDDGGDGLRGECPRCYRALNDCADDELCVPCRAFLAAEARGELHHDPADTHASDAYFCRQIEAEVWGMGP